MYVIGGAGCLIVALAPLPGAERSAASG